MATEETLVTLLTTQHVYQKMQSAMINDEDEQEKYYLTKNLTGTAKDKVLNGTFKDALEKVLLNYGIRELTPQRQEILNDITFFLDENQSKDFYDGHIDTDKSYNVLQISCYDGDDNLIHVPGNPRNFALLNDKVAPYVVNMELDGGEKVKALEMRVDLRAMNAEN